MEPNTIWFILIVVLYIAYFVLDGFDLGVGILLPFLGKNEARRKVMIGAIGPHWDGNEVWLITAGGATFAAFPSWYATLFSGFYLPLFIMLIALILRGIAFEFRGKIDSPRWRTTWDYAFFLGSLIPSLLWGVAFANFLIGVPIDAQMNYTGGFWNLLNGYALLGGFASILLITLQGILFLTLKTAEDFLTSIKKSVIWIWVPALISLGALFYTTYFVTEILQDRNLGPSPVSLLVLLLAVLTGIFIVLKKYGIAFIFNSLTIAGTVSTLFSELYPRVMISSLNVSWSLDIYNTASGTKTLNVMTIVAAVFVPLVILYTVWSYWIFRKRLSESVESLHY